MTAAPTGASALLNKMPRWFAEQARSTKDRAQHRREVQAKRLEFEFLCNVEVKPSDWQEWQDTVADFASR